MNLQLQQLRAETFKNLRDWEKTTRAYEAVLSLKPKKDRYKFHTDVAEIYIRLKKNQKARDHLMKALRLKPSYARAQQLLEDLR